MNEEEQAALRDILTLRIPPTEELRALTRQLFTLARGGAGHILRRQVFEGALPHECRTNAVRWVETHPRSARLPGFILFTFGWELRHVRFVPHVGVFSAE